MQSDEIDHSSWRRKLLGKVDTKGYGVKGKREKSDFSKNEGVNFRFRSIQAGWLKNCPNRTLLL